MIDTHAHLSDTFCDTPKETNLSNIILSASNINDSINNVELSKKYAKYLWAAVGVHPQNTDPKIDLSINEQINILDKLIDKNKINIKAVGECGLDYSPASPEEKDRDKKEQETLFRAQICLAEKYKLPLIIHTRKAVDETIEILKDYKNVTGVFHCYTGGKKRIKDILDLQSRFYFGIDGNITYEDGLAEVVNNIPKDRLVLETDSPFLTPVPHRGEQNSPANIFFIYEKVAQIWGKDFKETEEIIDENVRKLFGI